MLPVFNRPEGLKHVRMQRKVVLQGCQSSFSPGSHRPGVTAQMKTVHSLSAHVMLAAECHTQSCFTKLPVSLKSKTDAVGEKSRNKPQSVFKRWRAISFPSKDINVSIIYPSVSWYVVNAQLFVKQWLKGEATSAGKKSFFPPCSSFD